jgi:chemotaxis signal transduction protein
MVVKPLYNVMTMKTDRTNLHEEQTSLLENRFILTQLQNSTLVFPATWVTEILRIDRSNILILPFYNPLMQGIVDRNGQTISLLNTAQLLGLTCVNPAERLVVVRLNETAEKLKNVGLIVDRLIGNTTRDLLPPDLFTDRHSGEFMMMQSALIPDNLWQPQYSSIHQQN